MWTPMNGRQRTLIKVVGAAGVLGLLVTGACGGSAAGGDGDGDGGTGGPDGGPGGTVEMTFCGQDDGPPPVVSTVGAGGTGDGQVAAHCGSQPPTLDMATNDPFEQVRYEVPADNMIPPFEACKKAYQTSMGSRPRCTSSSGVARLVSKRGDADPRWSASDFASHHETIQGAIDAADHCDTIIVRPGVYKEYLRIEGKDVRILSDTFDESGDTEDGDQRTDYTADRIDLGRYYDTGERVVVESRTTYRQPLKRAVRTILEGGGYAEGPTLGGTLADAHDPNSPNRGCGNRRPMVDFVAGTTRNTVFDGFTVRLMPEQDHTIPGHGHTLQMRGGSPIVRNNIIYNNGSTGAGIHANFQETTPVTPPCDAHPELAQETFRNADYRASNVAVRPVPLVYGNISYQNNGLGMGNNHYSCAVIVANELFWNAVPGEAAEHQSPGVGTRHGAKTCIDLNVVYENAWGGITAHQGDLQPADECSVDPVGCNHVDERTQTIITRNVVFANGADEAPETNRGGIAVDGVGLPDAPSVIRGNVSFGSRRSGIGVRNDYGGVSRGFLYDDTYAEVVSNVSFSNTTVGIVCDGSEFGTTRCSIDGNNSFWNRQVGIGFRGAAMGTAAHNVAACNTQAGIQTSDSSLADQTPVLNNIAWANVTPGLMVPGDMHDYNLLSANNGQDTACPAGPQSVRCMNMQIGAQSGATVGENELFVDPMFEDASGFDFRLRAGSPGIDSGTDASSRPAEGGGPDRGSYEQ